MKARLLKDLPRLKAGAIFKEENGLYYCPDYFYVFNDKDIRSMPEWFEILPDEPDWPKSWEKYYYMS